MMRKRLPRVLHKKSMTIYEIVNEAINTTNDRNGQAVVLYRPLNDTAILYARERIEFWKKFSPVTPGEESGNIICFKVQRGEYLPGWYFFDAAERPHGPFSTWDQTFTLYCDYVRSLG